MNWNRPTFFPPTANNNERIYDEEDDGNASIHQKLTGESQENCWIFVIIIFNNGYKYNQNPNHRLINFEYKFMMVKIIHLQFSLREPSHFAPRRRQISGWKEANEVHVAEFIH